jgi:uncharacterized membrane protein YkvA (DUF1232 family)
MTFEQLFKMITKSELSPEQFGSYLGISGMTIRRWQEQDPQTQVPELYQLALVRTVEKLVMEGFLKLEDEEILPFLKDRDVNNLKLNLRSLGLDLEALKNPDNSDGVDVQDVLRKIGEDETHQEQVLGHLSLIRRLAETHKEMKQSVQSLIQVVSKKNLNISSKLVAFGALFYLIAPLDMIPDAIPVFGYVDDIAVLNLAAVYYATGLRSLRTKAASAESNEDKKKV